jgi:hypothetical protein
MRGFRPFWRIRTAYTAAEDGAKKRIPQRKKRSSFRDE